MSQNYGELTNFFKRETNQKFLCIISGYGYGYGYQTNPAAAAAQYAAAATNSGLRQQSNFASSYQQYAQQQAQNIPLPGERRNLPGSYPGNQSSNQYQQNSGTLPGSYQTAPAGRGQGGFQGQGSNFSALGSSNTGALGKRSYDSMANQYHKYDGKRSTMLGGRNPEQAKKFKSDYNRGDGGGSFGGIPAKDDSKIPVDKTLIDPKFNFWNLPAAAKVLIVSNVPLEVATPRALFHIFSFYGDVYRVKILKPNVALVEFATATMACIARNNLDQVAIKDKKLVVSFSRYGTIKKPGEDGSAAHQTEDFTGDEFKHLRRFSKEELFTVSLKRICAPKTCVHINNIPQGRTAMQVKDLFAQYGVQVKDILAVKKRKEKPGLPTAPSRALLFVDFHQTSDALVAMGLVGGAWATEHLPAGLRVSFTESSVSMEKAKLVDNTKMEILAINQPL